MRLTVVPAYGRDYKSNKEVQAAWNDCKDFLIQDVGSPDNGRYVNRPQLKAGDTVSVRFAQLRKVCVIKVK